MAEISSAKKTAGTALVAVPSAKARKASASSAAPTEETLVAAAFSFHPLRNNDIYKKMETMMTQSKTQYDKFANDAASASKESVEAFLKFTNIWMKGSEDIVKTYMNLAQEIAAKNTEAFKTLLACKNLNELTEVQNKLAQETFDGILANATKLSELTVKVTTDALEPINDQVSKSIRKATESVAA